MLLISVWLEATQQKSAEMYFPDDQAQISFGSERLNDIILPGKNVSRFHAKLIIRDRKFILIDQDSVNRIWIYRSNEIKEVSRTRILPGTLAAIGGYFFMIEILPNDANYVDSFINPLIQRGPLDELDNDEPGILGKFNSPRGLPTLRELPTIFLCSPPFLPHESNILKSIMIKLAFLLNLSDKKPAPTRQSLRKLLYKIFPTDSDLDSFLIDHFFEVKQKCGIGMDRNQKINILFENINPEDTLLTLTMFYPDKFSENCHLLQYIK